MFRQIEEIRETLLHYLESRIELFQLEQRDRIEQIILKALYLGIGLLILFMALLFSVILVAIGLNRWLDSYYAGYLIMLSVFIALTLVWFLFRTWWLNRLWTWVSGLMHKKESINP